MFVSPISSTPPVNIGRRGMCEYIRQVMNKEVLSCQPLKPLSKDTFTKEGCQPLKPASEDKKDK